jgi:formate dehydrogenase alpha subunit
MPRLTIDGTLVEVEPDASVLDAVNRVGVYLPQLCKDPDTPRLGTCRTCLVEVQGASGPVAACCTPAVENMVVHTSSPMVDRIRAGVLQLTLDMLPDSDPTHLGDLGAAAARYGLVPGRFRADNAVQVRHTRDDSNPFWQLDRQRCILCARCVAACQDVQHVYALALIGQGENLAVGPFRLMPVASSNCTSCGQCVATCPTTAIRVPTTPAVVRRVETTCPYCGVGCGIVLNVSESGEIVQVDDVPGNPSSGGRLCVKGRFGLGFVSSADRLTVPLVRRQRGAPLEPASWDEALETVADALVRHRGRVGVLGSAKATNEDGYVLQKFARAVLGTNNIDHCSRLCHAPSVAAMLEMLGGSSTTNSYADFELAGCLVVAGADPDSNHPVIAARLRHGVATGAHLVVVNPKRIDLCDIADVWLRPLPGTDVALFNGLARVVLDENLWDHAFVGDRTEGFDAWRAFMEPYSVANVARLTGVGEVDLRNAARLLAKPGRGESCFLWGMGLTQHSRGTVNVQALVNLGLLTGNVGKLGSGLHPLRGQNNVQGCGDAGVLPDQLPGFQGLAPEAVAKFAAAWECDLPAERGLRLTEMFGAALHGDLRALYLCGENPLLTEPNLAHAREALGRLEFLVVQTAFPNETTELADVMLPAAVFAEKTGTFTNSERRVQLVRQALEPPGEARADWAITCDLAMRVAARLERPSSGFAYASSADIFDELAGLVPWLAGMSHRRLDVEGGLQWPCPAPTHPGTPRLFSESFPRGRARFMPVEQGLTAAEMPDADYPFVLNTGRVLPHWHGGDLSRRVRGLVALYPEVEILINPLDADHIRDGDLVRVASRRGQLEARARLTEAVRAGEVFLPFVRLDGAAANLLTNDVYDPRAGIPEFKACAVRIRRAED